MSVKTLFKGRAPSYLRIELEGEVLVSSTPISFFGDVDVNTGAIVNPANPLKGRSISGKILLIPHGRGSTVGSYILYRMSLKGTAPKCVLALRPDTMTLVGCVIADIPIAFGFPESMLTYISSDMHVSVKMADGQALLRIL